VRLCDVRWPDCEKRLPQPSCTQAYGWLPKKSAIIPA
jgi:hypothetical protein